MCNLIFTRKALLFPNRLILIFHLLTAGKLITSYASRITHNLLSLRMILYNISIIIEDRSHDQVVNWLKSHLRTSTYEINFLKMLDSPHEGTTYCVQLLAADDTVIFKFQEDVVAEMQTYLTAHHPERAFIFESKMQYLSLE